MLWACGPSHYRINCVLLCKKKKHPPPQKIVKNTILNNNVNPIKYYFYFLFPHALYFLIRLLYPVCYSYIFIGVSYCADDASPSRVRRLCANATCKHLGYGGHTSTPGVAFAGVVTSSSASRWKGSRAAAAAAGPQVQ